jgi:hypothetical protein
MSTSAVATDAVANFAVGIDHSEGSEQQERHPAGLKDLERTVAYRCTIGKKAAPATMIFAAMIRASILAPR